ncbi:MAG: TonB-dependent receptor [Opitutaceae bacterium]|nr:TonB-dependent receptor [Opitutaceae bacterium]
MRRRPFFPPLRWLGWLCAWWLGAALAGAAEARTFDIPAGDAADTLKLAARQGGLEIVFFAETVRGVTTPALRGQLEPRDALDRLVAGTGLAVVADAAGTLTVRRSAPLPPVNGPAAQPPSENPAPMKNKTPLAVVATWLAAAVAPAPVSGADVKADETIVLTPFTINAQRDVGFVAASALAGGRLATDLKDTPVAYSVLTREFIDALGVSDVTEAAAWTTNASFAKDDGRSTQFGRVGFNDLVNFRGVPANRAQVNFFPVHFDYDSYNLERFDFARGPNSILFGTGSVGGSANGLYKEARTDKAASDVSLRVGSWEYYRATVDVNQPLSKNAALRANVLWQDNGTWRDREWQKREAASLHFMLRPFETTKIVVVGDKGKVRRSYGTTTIGDRLSTWDGTTYWNAPLPASGAAPAVTTGVQRVGNPGASASYIFAPGGSPIGGSVVNWAAMGQTATSHQTGALYGPNRTPVAGNINPGFLPEALHNRINVPENILGATAASGFRLPGRKFSAAFDDTGYLNDYHNIVATIEQQIGKHIFLQGSANTSEGLRGSNFGTARGLKDGIQIDINRLLPTGATNPYFQQPYIQTTNDFDQVNTKSDQYRGSAAVVFNNTRFGDFRFNAEIGHEKLINSREKYRYAVSDPNVDARLWASSTLISWRYYYQVEGARPMRELGSINVVDPVAGTTRTLATAYTLDTARPTETIYTDQNFDYKQGTLNAKFFKGRLNLIGAIREDEYETDSKSLRARMELPTNWNGTAVIYRPAAPANYRQLTYVPKAANGTATGQRQEATTRPRDGAGVGLPQYANDVFQDDFSPPSVSGKTTTYSYGGVLHVTPWVSVFANYAETWSPPGVNLTILGQVFGPDVSEGWDTGLRFSLLGGRVNASALRYEGKQTNLTVATGGNGQFINNIAATNVLNDLSPAGINARGLQDVPRTYNDTVSRKTEGYEFEVTANVTRGWRLLANVAFAKASQGDTWAQTRAWFAQNQNLLKQILSDAGVGVDSNNVASFNAGTTVTNSVDATGARDSWNGLVQALQNTTVGYQKVARLTEATGNLFSDYTIQNGPLKNFRFGGGVNYRGREVIGFRGADTIRNPANPAAAIDDPSVNAFDAVYRPSYYTATAMFGYSRRLFDYPVTFNLRIENLLNEDTPLYYNTVQRPAGGDLSNPGRVATPNLFSYITPRNFMLTMSVKF